MHASPTLGSGALVGRIGVGRRRERIACVPRMRMALVGAVRARGRQQGDRRSVAAEWWAGQQRVRARMHCSAETDRWQGDGLRDRRSGLTVGLGAGARQGAQQAGRGKQQRQQGRTCSWSHVVGVGRGGGPAGTLAQRLRSSRVTSRRASRRGRQGGMRVGFVRAVWHRAASQGAFIGAAGGAFDCLLLAVQGFAVRACRRVPFDGV
jgi:hypothetical protein